jgi:hypothetical protein
MWPDSDGAASLLVELKAGAGAAFLFPVRLIELL